MLLLVKRLYAVACLLILTELGLIFVGVKVRGLVPRAKGFELVHYPEAELSLEL